MEPTPRVLACDRLAGFPILAALCMFSHEPRPIAPARSEVRRRLEIFLRFGLRFLSRPRGEGSALSS